MRAANYGPTVQARFLTLARGLYSIRISLRGQGVRAVAPAICLAVPPAMDGPTNEVALAGAGPEWQSLPPLGYLAFAEVRSPSGTVLVGATGASEAGVDPFEIVVTPMDAASAQPQRDEGIPAKIKLRIERLGWRHFPGKGWATSRNGHLRILEIGIEADDAARAFGVELNAFTSGDRQTGWRGAGEVASFGEADISLTGFSARLAAAGSNGDLSIGYSGAFKEAGVVAACFDGKICRSPIADDPLVGVSLWIRRQGTG